MKKPQKPPDIGGSFTDEYNEFVSRFYRGGKESQEIGRLIRKYNELEYIHWDDLRYKKIPYDPTIFWYVIRTMRSTKYREIRMGEQAGT